MVADNPAIREVMQQESNSSQRFASEADTAESEATGKTNLSCDERL